MNGIVYVRAVEVQCPYCNELVEGPHGSTDWGITHRDLEHLNELSCSVCSERFTIPLRVEKHTF